ncbi:MAG: hypothetical protein LBS11_10180 [Oscillospiraceae bacterium]|nr:hypothetical protein [Oscillospiraceae bacterium]
MKKWLALLLVAAMTPLCAALAESTVTPQAYPWNDETILDSALLPSWEGKQLELTWWYGHGVDPMNPEVSTKDVVEPEIERVTGVKINYDESFSNGAGTTFDVRLAMLAGTKDWPSLVTNAQLASALIEGGVVYDLTDLIPKYMPNLMKLIPRDDPLYRPVWESMEITGGTDRIWSIPIPNASYELTKDLWPLDETEQAKYGKGIEPPTNFQQSAVVVRDDILKMIYPQAKTMDEIEALYMEKGYFDKEDVYDVPIRSAEDFYEFLRKIDALGLTEGNQKVYSTYASAGIDNYPLGARLASNLFGWGTSSDCFTYWDNVTKTVRFAAYEDEVRSLYKTFNQLVREDVVSPESLIDDTVAFQAKLNNGVYAVAYAEWCWPDNAVIEANKPYRYRPLYFDIPIRTDKYPLTVAMPNIQRGIMIFKDSVKEEDLPQILMWADFHLSEAYANLQYWGPSTAGLYQTNEQGERRFTDPAIEEASLYNNNPKLLMEYNLTNGLTNVQYKVRRLQFWPFTAARKYSPYIVYDEVPADKSEARQMFSSGMVDDYRGTVSELAFIWNFTNVVPGVEKMWAARQTWEDTMMKSLAAQSEAEFDRLYDEFIAVSKQIGVDEDTLAACTDYFVNTYNAAFMDALN